MITTEQVIQAASAGTIERYLGAPPYALDCLQDRIYCLHSAIGRVFLKWIAADDPHGHNEIRINRRFVSASAAASDFPGPGLLFVVPLGSASLAGWEWSAGADLRQRHRQHLPWAFTALGQFHARQRNTGPVASPATHRTYAKVAAMLAGELAALTTGLEPAVITQCARAFRRLEVGYGTCIHGDLHPGNIRVAADKLQLVDWGYAANSLNLFDLAYVRRHPAPPAQQAQGVGASAWWEIGPGEADAVLAAYFTAWGMRGLDWEPLHWAVEVWSTLHDYHNAQIWQDVAGANSSRHRLLAILAES